MFTSENNWYSWQYGDGPLFGRQTGTDTFKTHFSKFHGPIDSFGSELIKAAKSTVDSFPGLRPSILFSGGVDSEIVLRTFINIGANPDVYIMRFEKDINLLDVSYAVSIANSLGVKYHLVDINLKSFYENEAESISEKAQVDFPKALPQMKFLEYADGLPIYASSDPSWYRTHNNYTVPGTWISVCHEHDVGWSKYIRYINRPAIAEWFKWTPGLVLSYTKLEWFKKLINDGYPGKLGVNSTKIIGYREVYPELMTRQKLTGFENAEPYVDEFEIFLEKKYKGLPYRNRARRSYDELWNDITG